MKYLYFLLLLTICESKVQINITASNYIYKTFVRQSGSDLKLVTDEEVQLFNITNENINRGVRVELGKYADEVFIRDPTVYGEVYKKYKWPEVTRKLTAKNLTVVEFSKQNIVLKRNVHINNSTSIVKYKIEMAEPITNRLTAIWKKTGLPDDDIKLNVRLDFGYDKFLHEIVWRDNKTANFATVIKKAVGYMDIQPGQSIETNLLLDKMIFLAEIDMEAELVGNIVVNYAHTYGKYHLWSPTVGNIMRAAKLENRISTILLLEVKYCTNARIEVFDKDTGKEIVVQIPQKKRKRKFHFPVHNNETIK